MNANLLPNLGPVKAGIKKPSADSLKKAAALDSLKKMKLKSAAIPGKQNTGLKETAMLRKRKDDE